MHFTILRSAIFAAGLLLISGDRVLAVVAPYVEDFSSNVNPPSGFQEGADAQWNVSGGMYLDSFSGMISPGGLPSSSTIQVTNVGGTGNQTNFTLSSNFTVVTPSTAAASTVGFTFLSLTPVPEFSVSNVFNQNYLADVSIGPLTSTMRIVEQTRSGFAVLASAPFAGGLLTGASYTFTLAGTYVGNGLLMIDFKITGGAQSQTLSITDPDSPRSGSYFAIATAIKPPE